MEINFSKVIIAKIILISFNCFSEYISTFKNKYLAALESIIINWLDMRYVSERHRCHNIMAAKFDVLVDEDNDKLHTFILLISTL